MAEELVLDGTRRIGGIPYARVSHISGYRVSDGRANDRLLAWRDRFQADNPKLPEDFFSQRGTLLHDACDHYLRTGDQPELHEWIAPFWPYAKPVLRKFSKVYWSEGPLMDPPGHPWPQHLGFTDSQGKTRYHLWSPHGMCGTPDNVAHYRGKVTLTDFKSSKVPYQPTPSYVSKEKKNGWYKYKRTLLQLSAYMNMIEYHLDAPGLIQQGHICVFVMPPEEGTERVNFDAPVHAQSLCIPRSELEQAFPEFLENLDLWKQANGDYLSGKITRQQILERNALTA